MREAEYDETVIDGWRIVMEGHVSDGWMVVKEKARLQRGSCRGRDW